MMKTRSMHKYKICYCDFRLFKCYTQIHIYKLFLADYCYSDNQVDINVLFLYKPPVGEYSWWRVDLGQQAYIINVTIFNRKHSCELCYQQDISILILI